jgi:hypothetical protein
MERGTGLVNITMGEVRLGLKGLTLETIPPSIRVDIAIIGPITQPLMWHTSRNNLLSTSVAISSRVDNVDVPNCCLFSVDFESFYGRTGLFELNKNNLSDISNTHIKITIQSVSTVVPIVQKGKGQAENTGPLVEGVVEILIPLSTLMLSIGCTIECKSCFSEYNSPFYCHKILKEGLDVNLSSVQWSVSGDNELGEHVLGCSLFRCERAIFTTLPRPLTINMPDIIDPKAKGVPTDAVKQANRQKFLESLTRAAGLASDSYSLSVGSSSMNEDLPAYLGYLRTHILSLPTAAFDAEAAALLPLVDDVRAHCEFWTLTWGPSAYVFLHRGEARRISFALFSGRVVLPVELCKKGIPNAPSDLSCSATGSVDLISFSTPGIASATINAGLFLDEMPVEIKLSLSFSSAPTPPSTTDLLSQGMSQVVDALSLKQVCMPVQKVDVLQELRDEICSVVRVVAREYVTLYPLAPKPAEEDFSLSARKVILPLLLKMVIIRHV